jgi:GNAT superfamily N-acetyltransferase
MRIILLRRTCSNTWTNPSPAQFYIRNWKPLIPPGLWHILTMFLWAFSKFRKALELQRIYVAQEFQGFSFGSLLISDVKKFARAQGFNTIWLQVWQKNNRAIKFYQASGFVVYDTTLFKMGNEVQQDFLMRFDLYY